MIRIAALCEGPIQRGSHASLQTGVKRSREFLGWTTVDDRHQRSAKNGRVPFAGCAGNLEPGDVIGRQIEGRQAPRSTDPPITLVGGRPARQASKAFMSRWLPRWV